MSRNVEMIQTAIENDLMPLIGVARERDDEPKIMQAIRLAAHAFVLRTPGYHFTVDPEFHDGRLSGVRVYLKAVW